MSCQGNGDSAVGSTPAPGVDAGLRELLTVLLRLLISDVGQEAQRDRVPLLWQQQQQEAQADDAGGGEAHHAEDHLVLQNVHSWGRGEAEADRPRLMTPNGNTTGRSGREKTSVDKHCLLSASDPLYPLCPGPLDSRTRDHNFSSLIWSIS